MHPTTSLAAIALLVLSILPGADACMIARDYWPGSSKDLSMELTVRMCMELVNNGTKVCWMGNSQRLAEWKGQYLICLQCIKGYCSLVRRTDIEKLEVTCAHHNQDSRCTMDVAFVDRY